MFNRADVPKSTLSIRGCEGFEHISILILTYIFKISRNQRHPRHFMAGSNRIKYSYVTVDRIEPNPFGRMEGWKDGRMAPVGLSRRLSWVAFTFAGKAQVS